MLALTKTIVAKAKPGAGWEFHYAKPPKQWDYKFYFQAGNGNSIYVDASAWEYVLFQYADGTFDIVLEARDINNLNETDKLLAAEILLDGVLGEEKRITLIGCIEVVHKFQDADYNRKGSISVLTNHISTLI